MLCTPVKSSCLRVAHSRSVKTRLGSSGLLPTSPSMRQQLHQHVIIHEDSFSLQNSLLVMLQQPAHNTTLVYCVTASSCSVGRRTPQQLHRTPASTGCCQGSGRGGRQWQQLRPVVLSAAQDQHADWRQQPFLSRWQAAPILPQHISVPQQHDRRVIFVLAIPNAAQLH